MLFYGHVLWRDDGLVLRTLCFECEEKPAKKYSEEANGGRMHEVCFSRKDSLR